MGDVRKYRFATATVCLVVGVALTPLPASASGPGNSQDSVSARAQSMPTAPAAVRKAFGIFRRAPSAADLLPPGRTKVARRLQARFVSRLVSGSKAAHNRAWAVARDGKLCVSAEFRGGGASGCSQRGGTWALLVSVNQRRVDTPATAARVLALLPDTVTSVSRVAADGTRSAVPVKDNAVDVTFTREQPGWVTWTWPDGTVANPFNSAPQPQSLGA